jgi:hypothetical protein
MTFHTVEWFSADEFKSCFHKQEQGSRVGLAEVASLKLAFEEAINAIPFQPLENPPGTTDYPGPTAEWYGRSHGLLFLVVAHTGRCQQFVDLYAQPKVGAQYRYRWQCLESFLDLPKVMLETIRWVNYGTDRLPFSVEAKFGNESWCMYQGASKAECEELSTFLRNLGSRFSLSVVNSSPQG